MSVLPAFFVKIEDSYQRAAARLAVSTGKPVQAYPLPGAVLGGVALVRGRVLVGRAIVNAAPTRFSKLHTLWANLVPFLTVEVPGARVRIQLGDRCQKVTTDREGYFAASLDASGLVPGRLSATATPVEPAGLPLQTTVHVPVPDVDLAIISDIDDTIIDSGVAHGPLAMLKAVLLSNASTRVPLEGAASLYRALAKAEAGADRPVFYLSTSPWNLADFLEDFLNRNQFPTGPLLLTDWGPGAHGRLRVSSYDHKLAQLRRLSAGLPRQRLVLLGDSGQADAEIYAAFAAESPERVAAVYIRNAGESTALRWQRLDDMATVLEGNDIPFLIADDSDAIFNHAQALGLISQP